MTDYSAEITLAAGSDRLVRRRTSMLFVAHSDDSATLASAFMDAPDCGAAVRRVKDHIIDEAFIGPDFVMVEWADNDIAVTVFGSVEATTSSRAAPRLSGASSTGLVEHRPYGDSDFEVSSGAVDSIDPITTLVQGSVFCGGFLLKLTPRTADAGNPPDEEHEQVAAPISAPVGDAAAIAPAAGTTRIDDGGRSLDGPSWAPGDLLADSPESMAPTAQPEQEESEHDAAAFPDIAQPAPPLVEARVCACGEANPPVVISCRRCGAAIGGVAVTVVPRPCVALLELEDGDVIDLDVNLSIGRDPRDQPGFEAVVVDLPGVSRHHLDVVLDGWDILVTDRSSKNGVMVAGEDGVPLPIEPEKAWLVRVGSTLFLGTNQIRVAVPSEGSFA